MCPFVRHVGTLSGAPPKGSPVSGRLLAVLVVVALAGCGGSTPPPSETVTPAPVPESTPAEPGVAVENDRVDGPLLGSAHAASLADGYSRVVELGVTADDDPHLAYRETLTVGESGRSLRTRVYEGPETARFVPDAEDAVTARSESYEAGDVRARRRTVDGRTERVDGPGGAPPLEAPLLTTDDAALVVAVLEGATVVDRTPNGGVRLRGERVRLSAVPDFLERPRNVTVRATVRGDGRVTRVAVRYLATLDGEGVAVSLDVSWSSQAEPIVEPEWYGG
jgi:predicted small lipoprotein YifL